MHHEKINNNEKDFNSKLKDQEIIYKQEISILKNNLDLKIINNKDMNKIKNNLTKIIYFHEHILKKFKLDNEK